MAGDLPWFWLVTGCLALTCILLCILGAEEWWRRTRLEHRLAVLETTLETTLAVLPENTAATMASLTEQYHRLQRLEASMLSTTSYQAKLTKVLTETSIRATQAQERTAQHQALLVQLHETLGRAIGGWKGLAVHSGPEHTPDLYVASRQNVGGIPKETWRCHHCPYREVRDASATERTDLARPAPEPEETAQPIPQKSVVSVERPAKRLPHNVVATDQTLGQAMRGR